MTHTPNQFVSIAFKGFDLTAQVDSDYIDGCDSMSPALLVVEAVFLDDTNITSLLSAGDLLAIRALVIDAIFDERAAVQQAAIDEAY